MPTETSSGVESKKFHSPSFLRQQRAKLERARQEIANHLSGARNQAVDRIGTGQDFADRATQDTEDGLHLNIAEKNGETLRDITDALKRLDRGTYGICEISGELIPAERLEALPFARCTVKAQSRKELHSFRHRSYGLRFDDTPEPEAAT